MSLGGFDGDLWTVGAEIIGSPYAESVFRDIRNMANSSQHFGNLMSPHMIIPAPKRHIFEIHEIPIPPGNSIFIVWTDLDDEVPGKSKTYYSCLKLI